jgi:mRNA turnover protein 4
MNPCATSWVCVQRSPIARRPPSSLSPRPSPPCHPPPPHPLSPLLRSFKDLRREWSDSRFILGKNKVVQIALTADAGSAEAASAGPAGSGDGAYRPGLSHLADDVSGNVGLLFTDRSPKEANAFFADFGEQDYARAGFVPTETLTVPAGRLSTEAFPHTQAETLRKLGVQVRLDKGVIVVTQDAVLCTEGVPITPEQGRLLKLFGHRLAVFSVSLVSVWKKGKKEDVAGVYERLGEEADPEAAAAKAAKARKRKASMKKNKGSFGKGAAAAAGEDEDDEDEEDDEDDEGMDDDDDEEEDDE